MPTNDITGVPDDWSTQLMSWLRAGGGAINPINPANAQTGSSVTSPLAAAAQIPTTAVPPAQQPAPAQQPYYPSAQGGMPFPQNPGPAASNMPYPGQIDPRGYFAPRAAPAATAAPARTATAAPAAPRSVAPTPVVTPGAPNLGYYPPNPRFGMMQSQVPSGRGPLGNNPIYTTMNLFGGGQQPGAAAPAAAAPAAAAPAAAPAVQGRAVPRTYPGEGWDVDAQGNPIPSYPTQMNPNQLASAVRKPNWWQNV